MSHLVRILFLIASAVIALFKFLHLHRWRVKIPYPPGPKGFPIIGNLLDIPTSFQWNTYTEWAKKYGDLIHINVLGVHLIIINSEDIANELIEKRSSNYNDRPEITVMTMNGWEVNMGLKHYGNEWRRDRRVLHQRFRREAAAELYPLELAKSRALLQNMLRDPNDFEGHFKLYPSAIIFYLLYGHEVKSMEDPLVNLTFETIYLFSRSVFPGTNVLNVFPPLRHLPKWTPLLKEVYDLCAKNRGMLDRMQSIPFDSVKYHMAQDTAVQSWVCELLQRNATKGEEVVPEAVIKALGASTFAEAQKRAQAEIDEVIGNKRLPTFDDRMSLPYCVPHSTVDDDIYNGYLIPKGSIVIMNQWAMWRDQRVYDVPNEFRPERFLNVDGTLNNMFPPTFGFGRRACVGKSMADASIWIALVSMLSVFHITKAKDAAGNDIEVPESYGDGIVSQPLPFKCSISPRSDAARQLILDTPPMELDSNPMFYD
ncbi:O-methylsterigmatocystin oxidoreductase [Termitomyces sp. J132]|nr:O-methylsterigmatocystin oxidoreductase [Termitomyces sp. J132]